MAYNGNPPDYDDEFEQLEVNQPEERSFRLPDGFKYLGGGMSLLILVGIVGLWLATGFYVVQAGEEG